MDATVMNYKGREPPVTCQKFGELHKYEATAAAAAAERVGAKGKRRKVCIIPEKTGDWPPEEMTLTTPDTISSNREIPLRSGLPDTAMLNVL